MVQIPCPSCGKPLPAGGCCDCGEIFVCLFCGWPERQSKPTPKETAHTAGWNASYAHVADAA